VQPALEEQEYHKKSIREYRAIIYLEVLLHRYVET
jgi:hypothetical protein